MEICHSYPHSYHACTPTPYAEGRGLVTCCLSLASLSRLSLDVHLHGLLEVQTQGSVVEGGGLVN